MLDDIAPEDMVQVAFRCTLPEDDNVALLDRLYKGGRPARGALEFMDIAPQESAHRLVALPFAGTFADRSLYGGKTRYSDGRWPVYYCSAEEDTAIAEASFHYASRFGKTNRPIFYIIIQATIKGGAKDLRDRVDEWPFMVGKNKSSYEKCWPLGRQAHEDPHVCALIVPSARKAGGTNMPTFREECIVRPKIVGSLELSFGGDKIAVKHL